MDNLIFREMRAGDEARMEAFYRGLGEESTAFFNVDHGNERRTMDFFGSSPRPNHRYYVAETDGVIAGHLFIWDTNTRVPWMGVAVRDDYQGQGVGSFMLRSLFGLLAAENRGGVLLRTAEDNLPARRLYEKHGFEHIGTHSSGELLYLKRFSENDK